VSTNRSSNTVYKEFVFSNVSSLLAQQGRAYTINDLASAVGLKPTNNFKRRVKQMVDEGLIHAFPAFSPRGGLMKVYTSITTIETKEIPF
jgi:hypothetical protein